jgi:hypothetical protein
MNSKGFGRNPLGPNPGIFQEVPREFTKKLKVRIIGDLVEIRSEHFTNMNLERLQRRNGRLKDRGCDNVLRVSGGGNDRCIE